MQTSDIASLAGFIVACFAVASSGAFFRPGPWYEQLQKPSWCPPNWLFAPAWTVLYIMIAVSGWLVFRKAGFSGAAVAFTIYVLQLLLNAAWSGIFFGAKRLDLAFGELVLLWLMILATILAFHPIDTTAAYLLIPYLCWVTFAGALNLTIWRLNARRMPPADAYPGR